MTKTNDQLRHELGDVMRGMENYGGAFIQGLLKALRSADKFNRRKIYETWTDEWERYRKMGETKHGRN